MLSEEPVRIRRDWEAAVVAHCDFCSHSEMTVPHADGGRICASCCDSEFLSSWQNYARSLATELLSLREQLAELKALPPVAEVVSKFGDPEAFGAREINILADIQKMPYGTQFFTTAKPKALPRHIFSMLVNELRDVPVIGCKRELIIGVLNRHGVIAEPVQSDPPATE